MVEIAWERKKTKIESSGTTTLWSEYHQLYPANVREVGPWSRDLQRLWFGGGEKMAYFWYPARASFGRCFARMISLPKIGGRRLGPLYACQRGK